MCVTKQGEYKLGLPPPPSDPIRPREREDKEVRDLSPIHVSRPVRPLQADEKRASLLLL